jgi:hypothetical protein
MQWSKVKKTIESRFSASVHGKVHLHTTQYGCQCGRAWITYQDKQVANFETILNLNRKYIRGERRDENGRLVIEPSARCDSETMVRGEFSRWDLHDACWEILHGSLEDALRSQNPVTQGLAFLDRRFGKRRAPLHRERRVAPVSEGIVRNQTR